MDNRNKKIAFSFILMGIVFFFLTCISANIIAGLSAIADLDRILDQVDGTRTASEIAAACAAVDSALSERKVLGLLAALDGEMVHRVELPAEPEGSDALPARVAPVVVVLGSGAEVLGPAYHAGRGAGACLLSPEQLHLPDRGGGPPRHRGGAGRH